MTIEQISKEFEVINQQMLELFIRRLELTKQLGHVRSAEGKPLFDRKVEESVLETAAANSPLDMQNYSIEFFRNLMNLGKDYYNESK